MDIEQKLNLFMDDYYNGTVPHPISNFLRLWDSSVALEIKIWGNAIRLSSIKSLKKNNGNGTAALKWIISLAETHQVCISGEIFPLKEKNALNKEHLRKWSIKNGFTIVGDNIFYNYGLLERKNNIKLII